MHYFIETLFHPLKFHLGSFVSRRRDTWGYIIHIQVLLELITESSLSLSPEPPAAARPPEESTSPGPCLEPRLAGPEAGDNQRHDQGPGRQHPGHTREKESWNKIKSIPVCINKTWSVKLGAQCFRLWIDDLFSLCNFEQSVMFQSTFCAKFKW